jgi:acetyltransferase-like isoleucine patch superfamily enzyme
MVSLSKTSPFQEFISDKCIIGNDVWIGANAIILAGVKVGDGAIIGANSFVNNDVQPYSIVAGTPARHVRYRFDKTTITRLLKSKWWEWDDRQIRQKIDNFNDPGILLA